MRRQRVADSLKVFAAFGVLHWWPSVSDTLPWPLGPLVDRFDMLGVTLFALWLTAPMAASAGLFFIPRDWGLRYGPLQVIVGVAVYVSLWWHLAAWRP